MSQETAPHLEKITRALGDKIGRDVTEEELAEQLRKFIEYGVPPDQAVRSILRQYGAGAQAAGGNPDGAPVKLVDLVSGVSFVNLLVRVVHVQEREIEVRGEKRQIWTGILGDDTGTRPFTAWRPFTYEKGAVVKIRGAYTKEFGGEVQVNLGDRAEVREEDRDALPAYESAVTERAIGELAPGIGHVIVQGRVLDVTKREVIARGEPKAITTGTLADETGRIPFTAWADLDLEAGANVRIETGYVKAYRGVPQFNFDDTATVQVLADDALPAAASLAVTEPVPIGAIVAKGGGADVLFDARILEVRPGSGLVVRCPEDNRVLVDGACRVHGPKEGVPDVRVKCVLDDGTGAMNAIVTREGTERLLGRTLEEARAMAKELGDPGVVMDELVSRLTGRAFRVRGNAVSDDFGMMLIVQEIEPRTLDVKAAATALRARILEGQEVA